MKLERSLKVNPAFNYAALTDIVMQLLIFFLLSSSFVVMPGVKVQLPKSQNSEVQTDRSTVITLTASGRLFLNLDEVTKATLAQKLVPVLDKDRTQVVILKAEKSVSLQSAVEVIDIAKGVGAQRFMIATEPNEGVK
ncbi:MAG TPA: biopolymer transporter ExbD [Bacteroidota bacterium]|nr:biopolymer transporter ExbD [Bacteroidota bacterium]